MQHGAGVQRRGARGISNFLPFRRGLRPQRPPHDAHAAQEKAVELSRRPLDGGLIVMSTLKTCTAVYSRVLVLHVRSTETSFLVPYL